MSDLPIGPGPLVGFINAAIDQGLSATQALSDYREAGGAIANERFYQAYGALRGSVSAAAQLAGIAGDQPVPGDLLGTWAAGQAGEQYGFVEGFFSVPGQHRLESQFYIVKPEGPMTLQALQDEAEAFFTSQRHGGTFDGWSLQFTVVTSVGTMTGRESA